MRRKVRDLVEFGISWQGSPGDGARAGSLGVERFEVRGLAALHNARGAQGLCKRCLVLELE